MKRSRAVKMLIAAVASFVLLTVVFGLLYARLGYAWLLAIAITFFTTSYHFLMRIAVGESVTLLFKSREFNYDLPWYSQRSFERRLYAFLKVKKWKAEAITAKPEQFDVKSRSIDELLHNMTQAELVHEICMVLSFVPLVFIRWWGAPWAFIITSVLACLMDSVFVIIQRYNRPRVMRLKKRMSK